MFLPRQHCFWLLLLLLQAVLSLPTPLSAADIYVASSGSDSNPGTQARPFREIRQALKSVSPGDTIYVGPGAYKGFDAVGIGSADQVTRLVSTERQAVILKTTDRGINNPNNMVLWQCTNFVVEGLQSYDADSAGMRIVECNRVTVRHCTFGNNWRWGIVTSHSEDLVLEYNDCYGSGEQHGIYVANSGDRPVVRGNRLHHNVGSGLRSNGDVVQGGDGIISGALIENNLIYNNGSLGGAAINADGLQDGIIRNNVIFNNLSTGIALFKGGGAEGPKHMKVINNTIIQASTARYNLRLTDLVGPVVVRNNLLYNYNVSKGPFSWNTVQDATWTDSDYNAFGGGSYLSQDGEVTRVRLETWRASGKELHSLVDVSPGTALVDASRNDYRLKRDSPLIDSGIASAEAPVDLHGTGRPLGAGTDIGAYEYGAFNEWKLAQALPRETAESDDSDQDGIPLLLEYALNSSPWEDSRDQLPRVNAVTGVLELEHLPVRADLQYATEKSGDLLTWQRSAFESSHMALRPEPVSGLDGTRQFIRLLVRLP